MCSSDLNTRFFSGKIGGNEFCDVVTAIHFLYEVSDEEIGVAKINGEIVNEPGYLGWMNHILGTDFSMKKRFRLWELFEKHCLERKEQGYEEVSDSFHIWDVMPHSLYQAAGGTEFSDICYLTKEQGLYVVMSLCQGPILKQYTSAKKCYSSILMAMEQQILRRYRTYGAW